MVAGRRTADCCRACSRQGGRMRMERPQIVASIADEIAAVVVRPTPRQRQILDHLNHLCTRLKTSAFQLAVLGQFKRGKSTFINALLGFPLLSTGVLPSRPFQPFWRSRLGKLLPRRPKSTTRIM
ncbi:MAG: dynamin family protein [Bradyrhizobium sp.]